PCVHRALMYLLFSLTDTATTEIYTLSLHDALPISRRFTRRSSASASPSDTPTSVGRRGRFGSRSTTALRHRGGRSSRSNAETPRSEEHTSELQSRENLVCRLLLEKKNQKKRNTLDT